MHTSGSDNLEDREQQKLGWGPSIFYFDATVDLLADLPQRCRVYSGQGHALAAGCLEKTLGAGTNELRQFAERSQHPLLLVHLRNVKSTAGSTSLSAGFAGRWK